MKFYLAPLEGITASVFRNAVSAMFGENIDKYFTPFIVPHSKKSMTRREKSELDPENNKGIYLVPQVLTKSAKDFLATEEKLWEMGYNELNINLGCPSGTVTGKGRGSGMLRDPDELERFLDEIFAGTKAEVSIKTRIGYEKPEEFVRLLEIYNKYPLKELIIHLRVKAEMYSGNVHTDVFHYASENSKNPLCYNGDITSRESYEKVIAEFPEVPAVMIGRGMVADPALIRSLTQGKSSIDLKNEAENTPGEKELSVSADSKLSGVEITKRELREFLHCVKDGYVECFGDERQAICKMKEIWSYVSPHIKCDPKAYKGLVKSRNLAEYELREAQALDSAEDLY